MTTIATAKASHQGGTCRWRIRISAPILFTALLLSACTHPPKAVAPVAEAKAVVKEPPAAVSPPAVDAQPAVTEVKPPLQLPDIPPPKKHDHNIEED